ncbi:MAG: ABC transporter permease [Bacillota bacterium]|uniref:ABC transporter permease n=1 Tax=Virgibacillus salarius TaxID=447199 RepID=UPI0031CF5B08
MFLAIRELLFAKTRYILIGLIMVLTASLIFIISGLAQGLSADNASSIQELQADLLILTKDAEGKLTKSFIPMGEAQEIVDNQGDEHASTLAIRMMNATRNNSQQQLDIAMFATEPDSMLMPKITEGVSPTNQKQVVADTTLKQEGVKLGDKLTIGEASYIVSAFTSGQRYSHTPVVFIHNQGLDQVNAIAVQGDAHVEGSFDVMTKEDALQGIPSYSQEQASLNMMIIFLYVIAAFVLAVFFYVITLQKREQFGVLKALGANNSYLIQGLMGQVVLLAVVCIALGAAITVGIGALFPSDMPFHLELVTMLKPAIIMMIVSFIGALLSLYQVTRIDPIEAIEGAAA